MGKSSKKVRNDRINTIRKQYDAFLEEDKKRRERNEYILGKLDKMRSSNALVPVSPTVNYRQERSPAEVYMQPSNQRSKPDTGDSYTSNLTIPNITLGSLNKHVDELNILKEISKKYILIPKRRTPIIESDYLSNKNVVDDDWKSKYNILDDLKRLEKEGQPDNIPLYINHNDENVQNINFNLSQDPNISDKQPPNLGNGPAHIEKPMFTINKEIIVEDKSNKCAEDKNDINKQFNGNHLYTNNEVGGDSSAPLQIASLSSNDDISVDQTQYFHNAANELIADPHQENVTEKEKFNSETNEKDLNLAQNLNSNLQIHEVNNSNYPIAPPENSLQPNYNMSINETNDYTPLENKAQDTSNTNISKQIIPSVKPKESDSQKYLQETVMNIGYQKVPGETQDLTSTERVDLYDEENNPEGQINSNETNYDTNQSQNQDNNSVVAENTQHMDHVEHESEINAFEAEQKEMFYSEQPGADFTYNQGDDNTGEYTGGYEQDDQYAYYEGVQQEQAYATNINEHEESTERYDPHYNEQYEGSYDGQQPNNPVDYENTNAYEHQQFQSENPQFENIVNYENQQENTHLYQQENPIAQNENYENILPPEDSQMYDQHVYSIQPESQEQIEQQLITEEGYVENPPVTVNEYQEENVSEIENVTDIIPPDESIPGPKIA